MKVIGVFLLEVNNNSSELLLLPVSADVASYERAVFMTGLVFLRLLQLCSSAVVECMHEINFEILAARYLRFNETKQKPLFYSHVLLCESWEITQVKYTLSGTGLQHL